MTVDEYQKRMAGTLKRVVSAGSVGSALLILAGRMAVQESPESSEDVQVFHALGLVDEALRQVDDQEGGKGLKPDAFVQTIMHQLFPQEKTP